MADVQNHFQTALPEELPLNSRSFRITNSKEKLLEALLCYIFSESSGACQPCTLL